MQVSRTNWKKSWLLLCAVALVAPACRDEGKNTPTGTSTKGGDTAPSLDVRGGNSDNEVIDGIRTVAIGTGGNGGELRITCSTGDINLTGLAPVTVAQTPILAGVGINVGPGQKATISGSVSVDFLQVQAGGELVLVDHTNFIVLGDVNIAGTIRSTRDVEGVIDSRDLSIRAVGIVNITGLIDCRGGDGRDRFEADEIKGAGGDGGEIFISSDGAAAPGPHIFISGKVLADGGDTFATDINKAVPGRAGQILIGTDGTMTVTGRISARGGFSINQGIFSGAEANGGEIQLIATGNPALTPNGIEVGGVREISANGGNASGQAGDGGSILLEAAAGTVRLNNVAIESRGGDMTFLPGQESGDGGRVDLVGSVIDIDDATINVSGGDGDGDQTLDGSETGGVVGGEGGPGGIVTLVSGAGMDVAADVALFSQGGDSDQTAISAGDGGSISVINLDEANPGLVTFDGSVSVQAGVDDLGRFGDDGLVCARGADFDSTVALTGTNNFPISVCSDSQLTDVVVHDLDCDDATIAPATTTTVLPAVTGIDFYRILLPTPLPTSVTINVAGEATGDIDMFVGLETAFGSTVTTDYCTSSETPGTSTESVTIDFGGGIPAGCTGMTTFISVLIDEQNTFVEEYTISVACTP